MHNGIELVRIKSRLRVILIICVHHPPEINLKNPGVFVQQYLDNPFLVDGRYVIIIYNAYIRHNHVIIAVIRSGVFRGGGGCPAPPPWQ